LARAFLASTTITAGIGRFISFFPAGKAGG
jgi:hypothetical protein